MMAPWNNERHQLERLADAQATFVERYTTGLDERQSYELERDLNYLIHLTYREATTPLTKQLTEFVTTYNRPLVFTKEGPQ